MSFVKSSSFRWLMVLIAFLALSARGSARRLDADGDGINDSDEQALAEQFLPNFHYAQTDECIGPTPEKFLFRLRHPTVGGVPDNDVIAINYVHLYSEDCGPWPYNHDGDNEPVLVFLRRSGGDWVFDSVSATAHWNDVCESWTASTSADEVWVGGDKHGSYTDFSACGCTIFGVEIDECDSEGVSLSSVLYNVGEADSPLFNDLGDISSGEWSNQTVWNNDRFLSAGHITEQLYITRFWVRTASQAAIECVAQCDADISCHPPTEECLAERDWCHWDCEGAYRWDDNQ